MRVLNLFQCCIVKSEIILNEDVIGIKAGTSNLFFKQITNDLSKVIFYKMILQHSNHNKYKKSVHNKTKSIFCQKV